MTDVFGRLAGRAVSIGTRRGLRPRIGARFERAESTDRLGADRPARGSRVPTPARVALDRRITRPVEPRDDDADQEDQNHQHGILLGPRDRAAGTAPPIAIRTESQGSVGLRPGGTRDTSATPAPSDGPKMETPSASRARVPDKRKRKHDRDDVDRPATPLARPGERRTEEAAKGRIELADVLAALRQPPAPETPASEMSASEGLLAPVPAPRHPIVAHDEAGETSSVRVTIERLEVHAAPPPAPRQSAKSPPAGPRLSLEEYSARRIRELRGRR